MPSKPLPPVLYKYYPPARIPTITEDWTIGFTRPAEFNDTFDSEYDISTTSPEDRLARVRHRSNLGILA